MSKVIDFIEELQEQQEAFIIVIAHSTENEGDPIEVQLETNIPGPEFEGLGVHLLQTAVDNLYPHPELEDVAE